MSLKVMTYNILNGGERREKTILQVIQAAGPDVVVLQEVDTEACLKSLAQPLGMTYFLAPSPQRRKVACLSRFPICHPTSPPILPLGRNVLAAHIEYAPNQFFRVIGVHLMANLWVGCEVWRLWEARHIVKHLQPYLHEPCLVMGDFNALAPNDPVELASMPQWLRLIVLAQGNIIYRFAIQALLSAGWVDCFRQLHRKRAGFTLPPPKPNARLDYIFANAPAAARLKQCWVVQTPPAQHASDHYPVMASFE